ncbi:MAG: hypothetical protein ABH863_05745 [Candidatus Micrarchaeota archaeon]
MGRFFPSKALLVLLAVIYIAGYAGAIDAWYNSSWHFRQKLEFNASGHARLDWPLELEINFTEHLRQAGSWNLSFDQNSLRVFEYNSSGSIVYEVPYQFDIASSYDPDGNAFGELVFIINGSTPINQKRTYYVYFDTLASGQKPPITYSSALNYSWNGTEFNVNNTLFEWYVDTSRGENTSGIYRVMGPFNEIFNALADERTYEYSEFTNGTTTFGFNFSGNASFVAGPVRISAMLMGLETEWGLSHLQTGQALLAKTYRFYDLGAWIKVQQNYTNLAPVSITRSSTDSGGLALEAQRAFGAFYVPQDNLTGPFSWSHASDQFNSFGVGFINFNQTGTSNYLAARGDSLGRVGINLSTTVIPSGGSISETAIMKFNDTTGDLNSLKNLSLSLQDGFMLFPPVSEEWRVNISITSNNSYFNRNETVIINLNITGDAYNLTSSANITIDNGTAGTGDDFNLTLYDDGAHNDALAGDYVFGANFSLPEGAQLGTWNMTGRVYGLGGILVSSNSTTFQVSDEYNVSILISNYFGLAGRLMNASITVTNYLQNLPIVNAALACNYPLNYSADLGNGTYEISFQAEPLHGNYTLLCNASKAGNLGNSSAPYGSEAAVTANAIYASPASTTATGITLLQNFNFTLQVNATNYGNGSANFPNFTLQLPGNWTASNLSFICANVSVGDTCISNFTVTVANRTIPGNFSVNATFFWVNPDGSLGSNLTQIDVEVTSNPILNITPPSIYEIAAPGRTKTIGFFTLLSQGNDALHDSNFSITGFSGITFLFIPANLSSLPAGSQQQVQINATVPLGHASGDYQGYANISTSNAGNISIFINLTISGANVSIDSSPKNFSAGNITQAQNQTFALDVNITNFGNATSFLSNITLELPSGISANASSVSCGNMTVGANCSGAFLITVLNATPPGAYIVNVSAGWYDLGDGPKANTTTINITVSENPVVQLSAAFLQGNATHGNTTVFGNFTLYSVGNYPLFNLSANITGLSNFTFAISPSILANLTGGLSQEFQINVTIPFAYDSGFYNGTLELSTSNAGSSNLTLGVFVNVDRDWEMGPLTCERTESPDFGDACEVVINNTGNTYLNISISPSTANYSSVNISQFTVGKQSSYAFMVTYNISGVPKIPYNATFTVNATNAESIPASRTLLISLVPFQSLSTALTITPLVIQNNQSVTFDFNITDANLVGIVNVTANVTLPNGTWFNISLYQTGYIFNASGNITQWRGNFPNTTGTTALIGNYSVYVMAYDNAGINGSSSGSFYAYPKLQLQAQTLSSAYSKGSTASVYFRARDLGGTPLKNANVTVWVRDNSSILAFNGTYVTAISGIIEPLPTFNIASDSTTGQWTLFSEAVYYDSNASVSVSDSVNSTFFVTNATTTNVSFSGLLTNFESADLYFGGDTVELAISVYDVDGSPLDPDSMNITVFAPNESLYMLVNFSNINRSSTGLYYYKFVVPSNASSGVYRAELNATKGAFYTRNLALFRISSSLFADVETSFVWYPSSVMTFRMVVYTGDGLPIDPTSMNLTVIDPAGNIYFTTTVASMTKQSTGYYIYNYAMTINTSTGNYYAQLFASKDSSTTVKLKPFRVSQGGPYDIRLELLDSSVYPGDYLDFRAVMENKGEVTQDVTLEYWVSDGVQTWFYGSEAVLTPAYQNTSVIRSAYIFTSQPPGSYTLYGRVTYDLIKPPIDVSYTFEVVPRPESTPTPAAGGPGVTATAIPGRPGVSVSPTPIPPPFEDHSGMQIISYPDEVAIQAGETKYPKIQIKNTGLTPLHNVTVTLAGLPLSWLEVLPSRVNALSPGDIATFVLKITAPTTEKTSVKKVRALALSAERKEEVHFDVAVFESKLALIEHQIQRLKEKVALLAKNAQEAEKVGKNVLAVWETVDQVQKYITQSENDLRNEQLDDALSNAQIADTLISKGNAQLISAPFNPPSYTQLPNWITLALGIVGTGMGIIVFWFVRRRKKQPQEAPRESIGVIEKVSEIREKTDARSLEKEKSKIGRALRLLEEELQDGTISHEAYSELKRRYDRKIADIEGKLSRRAGY